VTNSYELFPSGACNATLPLNTVRDEYTFACFTRLIKNAAGPPTQVVVPRDMAWPGIAGIYAQWNPETSLPEMKGGAGLVAAWDEPVAPPPPPRPAPLAREVAIPDLERFLATRTVPLNGCETPVNLDALAVQALLLTGRAVVPVAAGERTEWVALQTPGDGSAVPPRADSEVVIDDLNQFLADPVLRFLGGERAVRVPAAALRTLLRTGSAQLPTGDDRPLTIRLPERTVPLDRNLEIDAAAQDELDTVEDVAPIAPRGFGASMPNMPAFGLALYLPFRQRWDLLGYSRGALLNTLSLAPQEETTIEVFTWDRRKRTSERSASSEVEFGRDETETTKDSWEVISDLTENTTFRLDVDGRVKVDAPPVNVGVGGAAQTTQAITDVAKTTTDYIHESVVKTSQKLKATFQTKVSESIEFGREERVTRKVRNPNYCHALNLDYFEVLVNYNVETAFDRDGARLVVFVPNPVTLQPSRDALRLHEDALRPALLARGLAAGFDAARLLAARDRLCAIACARCECEPNGGGGLGSVGMSLELQRSLDNLKDTYYALAIRNLQLIVGYYFTHPPTEATKELVARHFRMWVYKQAIQRAHYPVTTLLDVLINTPAKKNDPAFVEDLWWQVKALPERALDPAKLIEQRDHFRNTFVQQDMEQLFGPTLSNIFLSWIDSTANLDHLNDNGLYVAVDRFRQAYDGQVAAIAAMAADVEALADAAAKAAAAVNALVGDVYSLQELAEAEEREAALLAHLNQHLGYYRFVLWRALDPGTRAKYLATLGQLGAMILPEAIGYLGDSLAFPLLLPTGSPQEQWFNDLIANNPGLTSLNVSRVVTLPTPGVTLDTRLGACAGCEPFLTTQRELELEAKRAEIATAEAVAAKERSEADRYAARLNQSPADLSDPDPQTSAIRLVIEQSTAPPP
jgi:hypothetical protein